MKNILKNFLLILSSVEIVLGQQPNKRVVCYYDAESSTRSGLAKLSLYELEDSLQFCSHLIYGYAGLTRQQYEISSLNLDRDIVYYRQITNMKSKYPHLKVYLSLGGDHDHDDGDNNKYIQFLESNNPTYINFIKSSLALLKNNGFDGLDLAFQFPRNKPRKVHSKIGLIWKKIKKFFTGNFIVDTEADTHKKQFTEFVDNLHDVYSAANLSLTLTVLPNVNSSWYFDIPKIHNKFEYINLFAFDFLTPERNPEEADFTAAIYLKDYDDRLPYYNIDFQVQHWINNSCPAHKLNLGIATYARVWKTTMDSGTTGEPVVPATAGPADAGLQSKKQGLLSWPEVCAKFVLSSPVQYSGSHVSSCKRFVQLSYGRYAFCKASESDGHGIWMSFDDPEFAGDKAIYAREKGLGGMALYDISYDDFRGLCKGTKYPILRSVASELLKYY